MKSLFISLASAAILVITPLNAKDYIWDGGGDNSSWNDPKNWSGDKGYPGKGDAAVFPDSVQAEIKNGIPNEIMRLEIKENTELELDQASKLHLSGSDGIPPLKSSLRSRLIIGSKFTLSMDEAPENITPGSLINFGTVVVGK